MTNIARTRHICILGILLFSALSLFSEETPEPLAAGVVPVSKQTESNWVDARRNMTDIGPFMSYTLELPGAKVAKAISIRVGDDGGAAICFDAETLAWRAAWKGNFIKFDGARYGLLNWPKPDGALLFMQRGVPGWGAAKTHYRGLHVNGKRVILSYTVDDAEILETPWAEQKNGVLAVTRTIRVGKTTRAITFTVAELAGAKGSVLAEAPNSALLEKGDDLIDVHLIGVASGPKLEIVQDKSVALTVPAHDADMTLKIVIGSGKKADAAHFDELASKSLPPEDLNELIKPGGRRWGEPLATKGTVGLPNGSFAIDTVTVPYENPFHALMFLSGIDFFENGDAAVCTLHGDVWIVRGIDDKLEHLTWQRFATGLYQPIGVKIVNNTVHIMGRDQLTVLHDLNGDGEADFYENFNNACRTSIGGHDYSAGLETDRAGNFYHVDPVGLHRISKDGTQYETIATGWRNAVTLAVGPGDMITVSPQEGNWTPSSQISVVKAGGYYGFGGPKTSAERPLGYDEPLCWIPHNEVDNSTGGHAWVTSDKWALPKGSFLNLSFGQCTMQSILMEKLGDQYQAAIVPLPGHFLSGVIRGRFREQDGQFYAVGIRGWQTSAARDGCLQRVRYTGTKLILPREFHVHSNGIQIDFNEPLDRSDAADPENFEIEEYNYRYASTYGSKEYKVSDPNTVGRDTVPVKAIRVSPDGKSLFLEIANVHPVMQMAIKYGLKSAGGERVRGTLYNTIHVVGEPVR